MHDVWWTFWYVSVVHFISLVGVCKLTYSDFSGDNLWHILFTNYGHQQTRFLEYWQRIAFIVVIDMKDQ